MVRILWFTLTDTRLFGTVKSETRVQKNRCFKTKYVIFMWWRSIISDTFYNGWYACSRQTFQTATRDQRYNVFHSRSRHSARTPDGMITMCVLELNGERDAAMNMPWNDNIHHLTSYFIHIAQCAHLAPLHLIIIIIIFINISVHLFSINIG